VFGLEVGGVFQVGHGAGDFQDPVVGAGAQALLSHGAFQQAFAVGGEFAVGADVAGGHLGVAVKFFAGGEKRMSCFWRARMTRSRIVVEFSGSWVERISL
jgi:hypothetical protein